MTSDPRRVLDKWISWFVRIDADKPCEVHDEPQWTCAFCLFQILASVIQVYEERDRLKAALKAITDTADDCPACDRGVLRHPENGHWPECPFGRAQAVIAKAEERR